jgi:hypothetical protein
MVELQAVAVASLDGVEDGEHDIDVGLLPHDKLPSCTTATLGPATDRRAIGRRPPAGPLAIRY